jgi:hypothetical protein
MEGWRRTTFWQAATGIGEDARVADFCAGLGGPARYLASERTLSRRLADEGATHDVIITRTRQSASASARRAVSRSPSR